MNRMNHTERLRLDNPSRVQFTLRMMFAATAILAVYCAALAQIRVWEGTWLCCLFVGCVGGIAVARHLGGKSVIASVVGGAIGGAVGFGIPGFISVLLPPPPGYGHKWGGGPTVAALAFIFLGGVGFVTGAVLGGVYALIAERVSKRVRTMEERQGPAGPDQHGG